MKLHANVFGSGTPFIILHGFLGMGDNWKTLGKKIADKGYEVHLVDQRNHGRSPHSDDFTYSLLAQDLEVYCNDNNLKTIILLGHSMGGKTAMYFASNTSIEITHLLIADIGSKFYPQHHQDILLGLETLNATTLTSRSEADTMLKEFVREVGTRQFLLKNLYWKSKEQLGLRVNLEALMANSNEIGKELPSDYLYQGTTLFLKGDRSNYILAEDKPRIKLQFPNAKFTEISKAGHWLHAENPKEFLTEVLGFINK
ncbi:alpha/beta fold hydrolase [Aquimarina sp. W85]|uniref:alpha/beta fold hydrolase n=1 Tax=Aquimarina rhodophyticola TaxID=3342246 RepID=UPI00366E698F